MTPKQQETILYDSAQKTLDNMPKSERVAIERMRDLMVARFRGMGDKGATIAVVSLAIFCRYPHGKKRKGALRSMWQKTHEYEAHNG